MFLFLTLTVFSQSAYQSSVSTFNFKQVFVSRVWKGSHNVLKTQKDIYLFCTKVARPISYRNLSFYRIAINYEQMTLLWTYYEHNMNICSKFTSVLSSFRPVFWSAITTIFQRFNQFLLCQIENLFKSLKQWNKLVDI